MASRNLPRNLLPALDRESTPVPGEQEESVPSPAPRRKKSVPSPLVFSDVHKGRPCTSCLLCKENHLHYTHPVKWKNAGLLTFLLAIEPDLSVDPDTCICRNCRDSLSIGHRNPDQFKPRWSRVGASSGATVCAVPGCAEPACRITRLANKDEIRHHLRCGTFTNMDSSDTNLCDKHYRDLHKQKNPESYQWKCAVCSIAIRGSNYHKFRACAEPDTFQKHLTEHTDYEGNITANDKVCLECYRYSLTVVRVAKENPTTNDEDLQSLVQSIKASMPELPVTLTDENKLLDYALNLSVIDVAQKLLSNHALTLRNAHSIYQCNIESLCFLSTVGSPERVATPRWLLSQLSFHLKHHMAYTCRVKKHGTILYRQGRELDALSHSLYASKLAANEPDYVKVCTQLNRRIRKQADSSKLQTGLLNIEQQIQSTDPVLWNMICTLTQSSRETKQLQPENNTKNLRRLFILHQIMYCLDNTCAMPFHILTADLIDCHGGSSELIKIFNRLGVCVSLDTLLRHIQGTVKHLNSKGLLQGINPRPLTIFTMDNIDFLQSYAQVFCGNQQLSWHGTTVQAVQSKPTSTSSSNVAVCGTGRRRLHALLSPVSSPDKAARSPVRKRSRARTGTEQSQSSTAVTSSYDFTESSSTYKPCPANLSIDHFRVTTSEKAKVDEFMAHATSYCLLRNGVEGEKQMIGIQSFFSISTKTPQPEVGTVAYIQVLDEVADCKETILHVISGLHAEYICHQKHHFLVLEGDAKTYDIIQAIKYEYGQDLAWLIPYPGDWHLLKNYQLCLMKPFFEAGLKDLAVASSYPSQSIHNCSQFKRTHHFLMEVWEALYRHMLQCFLVGYADKLDLEGKVAKTLQEFENMCFDELALYSVIRSFAEETTGFSEAFSGYIDGMSEQDDTWKFWARFVFRDCQPYVALFMAIRSENWHLRMASLKSMAANFTAFDHPICQRVITQHVVDVLSMPAELTKYLENGGFALSISGRTFHSVALDECHEMLINKHVKLAIVRPSKDSINRIAQYIPTRVKNIENMKTQLFPIPTDASSSRSTTPTPIMLTPDRSAIKSHANIQCVLQKLEDGQLLPHAISSNRGLTNTFRGLVATAAQSHDLLNFNQIGRDTFELRIQAYILKTPSVKVPQRRKRLQTLAIRLRKGSKRQVNAVQQELKRVQKCMRRKIAHANKTGTSPDVIGQQYIENPRALCTTDGLPVKGQKSIATNFYQARYTAVSELILHSFPATWIPDVVILEGMFLINTKPLHSHKVMSDYGNFLMKRFILPYLRRGSKEVHLLFDDPGRQSENPKQFEQSRRDILLIDHTCFVFFADAEVPGKWQQTIKCRTCKRGLTTYLSSYFVDKISPFLTESQKYVTSGATETSAGVVVTKGAGAVSCSIESTVDESDTRIWLHARNSVGSKKFILSPDTDVYHIGLPLVTSSESVLIQLSRPSDKVLKLLNLNLLIDLLKRDPDLAHIPELHIPRILQTLFVATGCDYISFFAGIGKAFFLKVFFEHAKFIAVDLSGPFVGSIANSDLCDQATVSQLAFIRLVGCAYFKKHTNAFYGHTPSSLMNSFDTDSLSPLEQHRKWLDHLRQTIWDRISSENETIPSFEALQYHWLRSCWVLHMWQQAESARMVLAPLEGNGWLREEGILNIVWDTPVNRLKVKQRVRLLMNGCGCKTGCRSGRCGCKKSGSICGAGCRCVNCENTGDTTQEEDDIVRVERYATLAEDVNQLMENVFGMAEEDKDPYSSDESLDGSLDESLEDN